MVLGFYPPQIPPGWLASQTPALSLLSVFGVLPAPNPSRLVAFPTPPRFLCFWFLGFYPPQIPPGWLPSQPPHIFAFGFWGFTRPKSPQVGCLPNSPRFLCFRFLGFYQPQIPQVVCLPNPRALFAFGFWGFTRPKSPQVGCLPNLPALSLLSVFGVLPAPIPPRLVAFPTPPRFLCFRFWGFTRPKSPQVGCLPNSPALSLLSVLGF